MNPHTIYVVTALTFDVSSSATNFTKRNTNPNMRTKLEQANIIQESFCYFYLPQIA